MVEATPTGHKANGDESAASAFHNYENPLPTPQPQDQGEAASRCSCTALHIPSDCCVSCRIVLASQNLYFVNDNREPMASLLLLLATPPSPALSGRNAVQCALYLKQQAAGFPFTVSVSAAEAGVRTTHMASVSTGIQQSKSWQKQGLMHTRSGAD